MNDQPLQQQLRKVFAANEPGAHDIPGFRLTLDAARRRLARQDVARTRWFHPGWAGVAAGLAAIAVIAVLALRTPSPSLQDDIRLAQSVSFESVWRSPSDSLLAQTPSSLMRDTPVMPRAGEPQFGAPITKEYL